MPKIAKELTKLEVDKLSKIGRHAVGRVSGLYLDIKPSGSKSWIFCVKIGNKRRYIGLGSFQSVSLKEAREKALEQRKLIDDNIDPILQKQQLNKELSEKQKKAVTFKDCAKKYISVKCHEWTSEKHHKQWINTLNTYANPVIGHLYVSDISIEHILKVLVPIWQTKTETATRVRERIEAVLGYAIANGYRDSSNPAIWKGLLSTQLATPSKIKAVKHQRSICYQKTPPFFCRLQKRSSTSAIALIFTILTAARSRMTREAVWEEIDFDQKIWTIPSRACPHLSFF